MPASRPPVVRVKICGLTNLHDVEVVVASGAEMIGLNFVPGSKRFVSVAEARRFSTWIAGRAEVVGVVADISPEQAAELRREAGLDSLQHHGAESAEFIASMPATDFKAVRVADRSDIAQAETFRGPRLLLDAKVGEALGGTGHRFDWNLVRTLGVPRDVLLAGGLTPDNVAEAVRQVRPWAVDVASGVERSPREKDADRVAEFVSNARRAFDPQ